MKTCTVCHSDKPTTDFYAKKVRGESYIINQCKSCVKARIKAKLASETPEERTVRLGKMRAYDKANPEKKRATFWKAQGIDPIIAEAYYQNHHGRCDICDSPSEGRALAMDHCHTSGKVRGMLCSNCNTGLGLFKDSPRLLLTAMDYLQRS